MRYPEEKIKEAILHPDMGVRNRAVRYFQDTYTKDSHIMPLVIQAIQQYGDFPDPFDLVRWSTNLPQTESTVDWLLARLNGPERMVNQYNFLTEVLLNTDPALLIARAADIANAPKMLAEIRARLLECIEMYSWDDARCWKRLEEYCDPRKSASAVDFEYIQMLIVCLARFGQQCAAKTQQWLSREIPVDDEHSLVWLEPALIELVGRAGLESLVPLVVKKIELDTEDFSNCTSGVTALARIGTPEALRASGVALANKECENRDWFCYVFAGVPSDLSVEICLQLLQSETDMKIRADLIHALVQLFAPEGTELARQILLKLGGINGYLLSSSFLVETCVITGERFPEFAEWQATEIARRTKFLQSREKSNINPAKRPGQTGDGSRSSLQTPSARPNVLPNILSKPTPPITKAASKVGRNDPCPCGSGKKYKNCCLKN